MTTEQPVWRDFLTLQDAALLAQCDFDRFRASGPGGQKRNVTDSAVRLRHRPSGVSAEANESRSQHENRARALRRLRRALALQLRVPVTLDGYSRVPEIEAVRTGGGRISVGRRDARFLPAVAALLDVLEAAGWRVGDAARAAGVSTASLGRVLAQDPAVWRAANQRRRAHGLSALRTR
ncbi:MAG: peptide chain release factor-like protein [Chloroflexi bacterium]|nr:peptide chain release factor-like protein [Chloroflexota bacterium]